MFVYKSFRVNMFLLLLKVELGSGLYGDSMYNLLKF